MKWLGQVFPVLLIVLACFYTLESFGTEATGGSGYAIAAAFLFGSVLIWSGIRGKHIHKD